MNKAEILEKSRKENANNGSDEMEIQVKDKSLKWTYITMVVVATIFTFIKGNQGYLIMDLSATVCISVSAGIIYRFMKTKSKEYLIWSLITLSVSIIATVRFFMGH